MLFRQKQKNWLNCQKNVYDLRDFHESPSRYFSYNRLNLTNSTKDGVDSDSHHHNETFSDFGIKQY